MGDAAPPPRRAEGLAAPDLGRLEAQLRRGLDRVEPQEGQEAEGQSALRAELDRMVAPSPQRSMEQLAQLRVKALRQMLDRMPRLARGVIDPAPEGLLAPGALVSPPARTMEALRSSPPRGSPSRSLSRERAVEVQATPGSWSRLHEHAEEVEDKAAMLNAMAQQLRGGATDVQDSAQPGGRVVEPAKDSAAIQAWHEVLDELEWTLSTLGSCKKAAEVAEAKVADLQGRLAARDADAVVAECRVEELEHKLEQLEQQLKSRDTPPTFGKSR